MQLKKQKYKLITFISLLTLLILLPILSPSHNTLIKKNKGVISVEIPKNAGYWNLTGSPIVIITDSQWSTKYSAQPWFSGSGTWSDPYVIENVFIDRKGSGSAIYIDTSTVHYIIRNCTLINAGAALNDAGIKISNAPNGLITGNNISYNNYDGIWVYNSQNITISNNTLIRNVAEGIHVRNSNNIRITGNDISNTTLHDGLRFTNSHTANVTNNKMNNNKESGIEIYGGIGYCHDIKITDNEIRNNYNGIYLTKADGNEIFDNIIDNSVFGMVFANSDNNVISGNSISNSSSRGIYPLTTSINNLFYANYFSDNIAQVDDRGIGNDWNTSVVGNYWDNYGGVDANDDGIGDTLYNVPGTAGTKDHFPIWDDGFNGSTIVIDDSSSNNWEWAEKLIWVKGSGTVIDPYVISGLFIDAKDSGSCIEISNSIKYFMIKGNTLINSSGGYTEAAIKLSNVTNGKLIGNDVSYLNFIGISLFISNFNLIEGNNASDITDLGIWLRYSDNNTINKNIVNNNPQNAIEIDDYSDFNNITSNTVNGNQKGIVFYGNSNNNYIFNNTVKFNTVASGVGIYVLDTCMNNTFFNNFLINNSIGFQIQLTTSNGNLVYYNTFINNTLSASDDGINNWDNQTIGNYWDDYNGEDLNDDGIGDTLYNITGLGGRKDNYPIWDDGDDIPPEITITDPINYTYHSHPPIIQGVYYDLNGINTTWYWVVGSSKNETFTGNSVEINVSKWSNQNDGLVSIIFFANDSAGNIGSEVIIVNKDTILPVIIVNSPSNGTIFDTTSPNFNLTVSDLNLEQFWYTIDGGVENFTSVSSGINIISLGQFVWDSLSEGSHTITFFANDSIGNIGSEVIIVNKDTTLPVIIVNSPNSGADFGINFPEFNLTVTDLNLEQFWYTIDGGVENFTSVSSGINIISLGQFVWDSLAEGSHTITFFANDTDGNIGSEVIIVNKDTILPVIVVNSPISGANFGIISPEFNLSISDLNLEQFWYTIDGGIENFTSVSSGINIISLGQFVWDSLSEGSHTITFFVNDSIGNIGSEVVIVNKDTILPVILVNSPISGAEFDTTFPDFNLTVSDLNLEQFWYTIDGGAENFVSVSSGINIISLGQSVWGILSRRVHIQ